MASYLSEHPDYTSQYSALPGYEDAFNNYVQYLGNAHSDSPQARKNIMSQLDSAIGQFKSLFKNSIGRDATDAEVARYAQEKAGSDIFGAKRADIGTLDPVSAQGVRNSTQQFIGDNFQAEANQTAVDKTKELQGQYGSLADQFTEMGKQSLGGLSDSLKQFSTSLFEKLRPQLNLMAQAGGYAGSGGQTLQEQGALKDLAANNESTLGQAGYDLGNQANAIRMQGASGPLSLASSFASQQPNYLASASGLANQNIQNYYNTMIDQQNALQRMGYQQKLAGDAIPSFGTRLWQNLAGGAALGFTGGLGNRLNQFAFDKSPYSGGTSGGSASNISGGGNGGGSWQYA